MAKIGKPATALVEVRQGQGSGSAFCIHSSGMFITNDHVVRGTDSVTLILHSGLPNQQVIKARLVRSDPELDLALLRADGDRKYPSLALGSAEGIEELTDLVAFGFPFGKSLTLEKDSYPSVSVHAGTVTSLRRKTGALHRIQMDAGVNPGCSGGPVLDMSGKVIGVVVSGVVAQGVGRTGLNFAIPVSHVNRFVARPDIQFTPPPVKASNRHEPTLFQARAVSLLPTTKPITLELILRGEGESQKYPMKREAGVYRAIVTPVPKSDSTEKTPAALFPYLFCTVVAGQDDKEIGRVSRTIPLEGVSRKVLDIKAPSLEKDKVVVKLPAPASDLAVGGGGRILVLHLPKVGKLAVFDVNTAKIRHFIAVDNDVKFAAGFDKLIVVSPKKHLIERYCLYNDEPEYASPLPMARPIRIKTVAMGSASNGPLLMRWEADDVLRSDRCSFFDIQSMKPWEITWRNGLLFGGGWVEYKGVVRHAIQVRASPEGTAFVLWHGSRFPDRVESLIVTGKQVKSAFLRYSYGHTVLASEGRITNSGVGLFTTDLKKLPESWPMGYVYIPAQQGNLTLALPGLIGDYTQLAALRWNLRRDFPAGKLPDKVLIYRVGDERPIASLVGVEVPRGEDDLTLDDFKSDLTLDKRIHFLPAARLILTIPTSSDRLVLHRVNVDENGPTVAGKQEVGEPGIENVPKPADNKRDSRRIIKEAIHRWQAHPGGVTSAAYSADGKFVFSGGLDGKLQLWDAGTGKPTRRVAERQGHIWSVALAPDGRQALSAGEDGNVHLWDVPRSREIHCFKGHRGTVGTVVFFPDGRHALSGGWDGTVRQWDVESHKEVNCWEIKAPILRVCVSPKGQQALFTAHDGTVRLWDLKLGKELRRLEGHKSKVWAAAFSPDGSQAVTGSGRDIWEQPSSAIDHSVHLWDLKTGASLGVFEDCTDGIRTVAFSPDGRSVLIGSLDKTLRLWDVATRRELACFIGHLGHVESVGYSPNGRWALSASFEGTLHLWQLLAGNDPVARPAVPAPHTWPASPRAR